MSQKETSKTAGETVSDTDTATNTATATTTTTEKSPAVSINPEAGTPVQETESEQVGKEGEVEKEEAEKVEKAEEPKQEKAKGSGCSLPGCSCKSCACLSCLSIIALIVLFGVILFFRPPFIWNSIKSFLNKGYNPPVYESQDSVNLTNNIDKTLKTKKTVQITEAQMQALVRKELDSNDVRVDIEPSYFRIASDIDNNEEHPLWLIVEVAQTNDNKLKITRIGFERIGAPSFIKNAVSDSAFQALELNPGGGNQDAENLFAILIDAQDNGITISSVRFDKDKITIEASK